MITKIFPTGRQSDLEYPCLKVMHKFNLVVLFVGANKGTCMYPGTTDNKVGAMHSSWTEEHFVPFEGTLGMSND